MRSTGATNFYLSFPSLNPVFPESFERKWICFPFENRVGKVNNSTFSKKCLAEDQIRKMKPNVPNQDQRPEIYFAVLNNEHSSNGPMTAEPSSNNRQFRSISTPTMEGESRFHFQCVPDLCDMRCCTTGNPIILNPFEIMRLTDFLKSSYEDIEDRIILDSEDPDTGWPLAVIDRSRGCPLLKDNRCTVYSARPLACRLYPIGKRYKDESGFDYVHIPIHPCVGFSQERELTLNSYLIEQQTAGYDRIWEEWIDFINRIESAGLPDNEIVLTILRVMIYNTDLFPPRLSPQEALRLNTEELFRLRLQRIEETLPRLQRMAERLGGP